MGQAFYRKYRSKSLDEVEGQQHITQTLKRAIEKGTISHAYLFTGPRGVGKTSVARILAHQISDLPYTDESTHLDIIEIDAASNRRIDEIRDLRDKVHIAPTSAKYKVYIIDEVHMLTREAFNALLKTLEEPPAHVVFILATTEIHKLPETIISRTQRFTFKPINTKTAVEHLAQIAKSENIKIDEEALTLLAEHGRGSFRDSISLLDQVAQSGDKITAEDVRLLIGVASSTHINDLLEAVSSGDPKAIVNGINNCIADGVNPGQAAKQLAEALRHKIIAGDANEVYIELLGDLLNITISSDPATALEVALFRASIKLQPNGTSHAKPAEAKAHTTMPAVTEPVVKKPAADKKEAPDPEPASPEAVEVESEPIVAITGEPAEWWGEVLNHIKSVNNTLYGILRMAEPKLDNDTLHLSFGFGFHKKKVADSETQAKINHAIAKVTGSSYKINAVHDKNMTKETLPVSTPETITPQPDEPSQPTAPADPLPPNKDLASITNIFGGAEVLES